jgi:ABC-type branched-subunit amino acid transport system ATPase component
LAGGGVALDGSSLAEHPPYDRIARGISRTFQTPRFSPELSVRDTVLCGFYPKSKSSLLAALLRGPAMAKEETELSREADRLLDGLGLLNLADRTMGDLPLGLIRLVDIARAMAANPSYILLDEPAAGLSRSEQATLVEQLRRLAGQGMGVLLVEHNFPLVKSIASNIVVLERGRVLIQGRPEEVSRDPEFVRAYLGSSAS